jgi:hypothetical protein
MLIRRRTFVFGTVFATAAVPLASLLVAPSAQAKPAARPTPPAMASKQGATAFKIHGWDEDHGDAQGWISINQAWRGTWR